ncbi:MAG: riboflavin synthase [Candidatus Nanohalobium sp.]
MFTGIVEGTVSVEDVKHAGEGKRIRVTRPKSLEEVSIGESISLSGACLTVEEFDSESISFFLAEETLEKTWFSKVSKGDRLNFETSLTPRDKMGGHIVQGHVETTAELIEVKKLDEGWNFKFEKPEDLENLVIEKGFIAIEGISLTVTETLKDSFSITIIPETWKRTNLSGKKEGEEVNLEPDMMAKYIQKNLEKRR